MNIKFALAGNPNCGKTTMFNALTGANQYVGNWPGVTVEKKEGKVKGNKEDNITVVDLPGIYSLSPYTLEEVVSRDFLLNEDPDVIIDLVDATNIERNLYLTTQLIETGVPVVVALNMADLIEKRGLKIDTKRLSMVLGCPIIETSALKGTGLKELIAEAVKVAKQGEHQLPQSIFSEKIEKAIDTVVPALSETITANKKRWYAVKVLENDEKVMNHIVLDAQTKTTIDALRKDLDKTDMNNYQHSFDYAQTIKNARAYQEDKDALIIIAGACQSYYELLLASGANFASSPKRINIHALDPVYVASLVANESVRNYCDIEDIINHTTHKQSGIGGIDTKGVARKIYPTRG